MTPTPNKLKIVGRDVDVVLLDDYPGQLGGVVFETQTINIKSGQQKYLEADTLLHETIHVIDEVFQLELKERQVYCLAVALMALFKDNPQMLPYIRDAIEFPKIV